MAERVIQSSFNAGELAPAMYARVDLAKYHSGAALLRNFFVDYRGGATTRAGTQYIIRARDSNSPVRLIPFQASTTVGYTLEFGDRYIRFINNKAPVLEAPIYITAIPQQYNAYIQVPGHNYSPGDWLYISGGQGMTELNNNYYIVRDVNGASVGLNNLDGSSVDTSNFGAYAGEARAARVYTIASPFAANDLAKIKFAQNVNTLILCHPDYTPQVLTLITATNWTILPIYFGSPVAAPTNVSGSSTLGNGPAYYSYVVTSVDVNGQESPVSAPWVLGARQDMRSIGGTNRITWYFAPGAVSYNVYKADVNYFGMPGTGFPPYGFIGNTTAGSFDDNNSGPDFSQTPPAGSIKFSGSGVDYVQVTNPGTYTTVPTAVPGGQSASRAASFAPVLQVKGTPTVGAGGSGFAVGDIVYFSNTVALQVASVNAGAVTAWQPVSNVASNPGAISAGNTPANPVPMNASNGAGTGASANLTWGVGKVNVTDPGDNYAAPPSITFSPAGAFAQPVMQSAGNGYPSVCGFFQQRLFLGGAKGSPGAFAFSQPGAFFNFNISRPAQADDAIAGTLVSGQLNSIKAVIPTSSGLIILTDRASWLLNGGSAGAPISPAAIAANIQSYTGSSDLPPIVANFDILFNQAKGSTIRDNTFNIYANVYTGEDITTFSAHLFYGYQLSEWAFSEEPFKIIWAVRNDGMLLALTFLKEQQFTAWTHCDTAGGKFLSVSSVTEPTPTTQVDAVYVVVERVVNGAKFKYIERMADREFPTANDSWCVDSGLRYDGPAAQFISGAAHLAGLVVSGLADGKVITPFVMPQSGSFYLPAPASRVTIGIPIVAQLKTLALDTGEPTIQGKMKKVSDSVIRVDRTLGLKIGTDFDKLVEMKDLKIGNVGSYSNKRVTDLVSSDVRTFLDPKYDAFGQFCLQQDLPFPATILGVMPGITLGDSER